jgi:type I restriction enzyme, S subunit
MADWQTKTLGEVLLKTETVNPALAPDVEFDYIDVSSVSNETFAVEATQRLKGREAPSRARRLVRAGDVILATIRPTLKRIALIPAELDGQVCSTGYFVLRPCSDIDHRFLFYSLFTEQFLGAMESLQKGASYPAVTDAEVRAQPISFPRSQEQRRIVAILDEAFEGIATAKANAEKNLQNARELFESKLSALLGQDVADWPRKTLREVSIDFGRGKSRHRPRNDPKLYGGPYPFIQTGDVRGAEHLITEYTQTYSEDGLAQSKLWPRGTLCITIAANIAETGVLDFGACFPDSVIGVVVDESQTSGKYLEYMLHTVKADLKAKGKGSAQDNINLGTFENERFPFPNLGIQAHVVGLLDHLSSELQRLEELYELKLNALNQLKKSLLHQAFTGQLGNATVPVDDRWAA